MAVVDQGSLYLFDNLGVWGTIFWVHFCATIMMLICRRIKRKSELPVFTLVERAMTQWLVWGAWINVYLMLYQPLVIFAFVSLVSIKWKGDEATFSVYLNNFMTITACLAVTVLPIQIVYNLYKQRGHIGKEKASWDISIPAPMLKHDILMR